MRLHVGRASFLAFCLTFLLVALPLHAAEKRVALVIGNTSYSTAWLANPVNDATDMAVALAKCGFSVTKVTDADKKAMRQAIRTFIDGLERGSVALFYFAGHAVQSRGENYMVPVGVDVRLEDEIPTNASVSRPFWGRWRMRRQVST